MADGSADPLRNRECASGTFPRAVTTSLGVRERRGEFESDAIRIEERKEREAERHQISDRTVLDSAFVEQAGSCI